MTNQLWLVFLLVICLAVFSIYQSYTAERWRMLCMDSVELLDISMKQTEYWQGKYFELLMEYEGEGSGFVYNKNQEVH